TNARHADPLPILVKTDPTARPAHRGMSVLLVEQGTPGFQVLRDLPKLGYSGSGSCEALPTDCRVAVAKLLGGAEARGLPQVLSALEPGRLNVAARAAGVAQAAYDAALASARTRRAFGEPIRDFQAFQV